MRWAECDIQNIVFFANYFLYYDVAITEYFRELAFDFYKPGSDSDALEFYTVHASTDYSASARCDDVVDVGVRCARLGKTSLTFAFVIYRGDELLVEGKTVYVNAEPGTKNKRPLPQYVIDRIDDFEDTVPER